MLSHSSKYDLYMWKLIRWLLQVIGRLKGSLVEYKNLFLAQVCRLLGYYTVLHVNNISATLLLS